MKSKYLFLAAAMPLAFTACQSDELVIENVEGERDQLGTLIEAPMLGVGVDMSGATRSYDNKKWYWTPTLNSNGDAVIGVEKIGLCWTGVNNNADGYAGPATTTGDMVYTNIRFDHAGWLYQGESAPEFRCGNLENGLFNRWFAGLTPKAEFGTESFGYKAAYDTKVIDFQTGMFKSDNGTIYEGEYIVYFPYNNSFWNAPVTAKQDRIMTLESTNTTSGKVEDAFELMTKYSFNVGYKNQISGGDDACEFSTRILSSSLHLNITDVATEKATGTKLKDIVLWSKGQKGFITSQALSAQEIKKAYPALTTDIYLDDPKINESSATLVVKTPGVVTYASNDADIYIPVLPNKIDDFNILITRTDGKVGVLCKSTWANFEFEPNTPKALTLEIKGDDIYQKTGSAPYPKVGEFKALNYAYDEESFYEAYKAAHANVAGAAEAPRTVVMLDDIELTKQQTEYSAVSASNRVIIDSDAMAEDAGFGKMTLTLGHSEGKPVNYHFTTTDFDVNVKNAVEGCCTTGPNNLTLQQTKTYAGTELTMEGGVEFVLYHQIDFDGDVNLIEEGEDEEGNDHSDRTPTTKVAAYAMVNATAEVQNDGNITIEAGKTPGKFYLVGAQMINDGNITVKGNGISGQDAVLNIYKNAAGDVNATLKNNGTIDNMGNIFNNSAAGAFTNETTAVFTDYVGSTLSGYRIKNIGDGEFICEVNSLVRYENAIDPAGIRPTTTLRFVYGDAVNIGVGSWTTEYTLAPQAGKDGIYVPYNTNNELIDFESAVDDVAGGKVVNTLTLNNAVDADGNPVDTKIGNLTIKSGKVTVAHEALTIQGNYTADGALNTYLPVGIKSVTGNVVMKNIVNDHGCTGALLLNPGQELNVKGDIIVTNVKGGVTFANGSKVNAKNLSVAAGQNVTFDKNNVTTLGAKDVAGTGVLTNAGSIDIVNTVTGSDVAAKVWCNSLAGNGAYANNSYPQYFE